MSDVYQLPESLEDGSCLFDALNLELLWADWSAYNPLSSACVANSRILSLVPCIAHRESQRSRCTQVYTSSSSSRQAPGQLPAPGSAFPDPAILGASVTISQSQISLSRIALSKSFAISIQNAEIRYPALPHLSSHLTSPLAKYHLSTLKAQILYLSLP